MFQRRRFKQPQSLEERLADEAKGLREQAELLPPGELREIALRKAQLTERALEMNVWLRSSGLQPPK